MNANETLTTCELSVTELEEIAAAGVISLAGLGKAIFEGTRQGFIPQGATGLTAGQIDHGLLSGLHYIFRQLNIY